MNRGQPGFVVTKLAAGYLCERGTECYLSSVSKARRYNTANGALVALAHATNRLTAFVTKHFPSLSFWEVRYIDEDGDEGKVL